MLIPIQLHRQPRFKTDKIHDIGTNWLLTPEFEAMKPAATQRKPQFALDIGLLAAQAAGEIMLHDNPSPGARNARHPLPRGEREIIRPASPSARLTTRNC